MFGTLLSLCIWLVGAFVAICVFGTPHLVPGHANGLAVLIGVVCICAGPTLHAPQLPWLPLYFIYGCIGGAFLMPLFLPDGRDVMWQTRLSPAAGLAADGITALVCLVCIVGTGWACRALAAMRTGRSARQNAFVGRCRKCGYSLYGLPQPRCPECGTPFDPTDVPQDDADA